MPDFSFTPPSSPSSPTTSSSVSGRGSAAPRRRRTAIGVALAAALLAATAGLSSSATATATATATAAASTVSSSSDTSDTVAGGANAARHGQVSGRARVFYRYSPHDDIRFSVDAKAAPFSRPINGLPHGMPTDARGTVTISHWSPGKKQGRRAEASVDCLVTGGDSATLSAVVTKSEDPEEIGERLGFSVKNGGPGK